MIRVVDAPTLSAIAAWVAAGVAATVAAIQFFIGRKQAEAALLSARAALMNAQNAGRHTIAEFRQNWIDKVIDTVCEHHSIVMSGTSGQALSADELRTLSASRTKLEILLNPEESDTVALLAKIDEITASASTSERETKSVQMLSAARRLLKREWVRIKDELE
jgi:hypothetical protein